MEAWSHKVFRDKPGVYIEEKWRNSKPLSSANVFPDKLQDFEGSTLIGVTFEHAPAIMKIGVSEDGKPMYDGEYYIFIEILGIY